MSECLASLSKFQLEIIAKNQKIQNASKIKKAELIEILKSEIVKKIEFLFDYKEVTYLLLCLIYSTLDTHEDELKEFKKQYFDDFDNDEFEAYIYDIKFDLLSSGFLFCFCNNEQDTFVFPQELTLLTANYSVKNAAKYEDFAFYIKVLTDLYGMCPIDLVQEIYNRDFPDKKIKIKSELIEYATKVSELDKNVYFENKTLYHQNVKEA